MHQESSQAGERAAEHRLPDLQNFGLRRGTVDQAALETAEPPQDIEGEGLMGRETEVERP